MYCDNEVINNRCWKTMHRLVKYCLKFTKWSTETVIITSSASALIIKLLG